MKLRVLSSILIFLSAYSPLSIIFLIQNFDCETNKLMHPEIVCSILLLSILSVVMTLVAVKGHGNSSPSVKIESVSNRSRELINYSIPYMISFFVMAITIVMGLSNPKLLIIFGFFMLLMYIITVKTHNVFINPILALWGYNMYGVKYKRDKEDFQSIFLIKGDRLKKGEECRIVELSEHICLVTERNPKV